MELDRITLGTRSTPLAVAQSESVAKRLRDLGHEVVLRKMSSQGDRSLGGSLAQARGMFTAELSAALHKREVDVVVHSLKDLPVEGEPGLVIAAVPERARPHDLLIVPNHEERQKERQPSQEVSPTSLAELVGQGDEDAERHVAAATSGFAWLPDGATIGTSSPRRQAGALHLRPDLVCCAIRGSVGRRLEWLRSGAVDCILLAEAGLIRLPDLEGQTFSDLRAFRLALHSWPTAPGQGALAVQVLGGGPWDEHPSMTTLDHPFSREAVEAERDLLHELGGGCQMPFGVCCSNQQVAAILAPETWRAAAARGEAPTLAQWHANFEGGPSAVAGGASRLRAELRARVHELEATQALETVAGPPDLAVTSSPASTKRLASRLPDSLKVDPFPCTHRVATQARWPTEHLQFDGARSTWPWILVCSPGAAEALVERCDQEPAWGRAPWCALGEGTARALLGLGVPPNLVAKAREGQEFAGFVLERIGSENKLLVPHSARTSGKLIEELREHKRQVVAWDAYSVAPRDPLRWPKHWGGPAKTILFSAPSAVEAYAEAQLPWPARCWALGQPTARALSRAFEISVTLTGPSTSVPRVAVASSPNAAGVAELWESEN